MLKVKIKFIGYLANIAGQREFDLEISDATLSAALIELDRVTSGRLTLQLFHEGVAQRLNKNNLFLINGIDARFRENLQTILEGETIISIIPPIVGG